MTEPSKISSTLAASLAIELAHSGQSWEVVGRESAAYEPRWDDHPRHSDCDAIVVAPER